MSLLIGAVFVAGAYAFGAIPWGVVLGRVLAGTDLRDHGSQSTGATNAYRVLGWQYSAAVFVLDFAKGLVPVLLARAFDLSWWVIGAAAVASVIGHCWSPYIRFTGGKGMATGAGAIVGMFPWVLLIVPVMVVIVWATRYVSLASLTGTGLATALLITLAATGHAPTAIAVATSAVCAIVFLRHHSNIDRLLHGNERRLSRRSGTS